MVYVMSASCTPERACPWSRRRRTSRMRGRRGPRNWRDRTSFNVFCVRNWGGHDDPAKKYDAWATNHGSWLIIDDFALSDHGPVLAHEIGHGLGLKHTTRNGYVMRQGLDKGKRLTV